MATHLELDPNSIARIGLLFLDGDSLEDVLLDKRGHVDYDFDNFNRCKQAITKMERINPGLGLTAILWQLRPDNQDMAVPVVAGRALPLEGHGIAAVCPELRAALDGQWGVLRPRCQGGQSHYYPVRNSDDEIVGALELLAGPRPHVDI